MKTRILDWLASQEGEMIALLEQLVNVDSGSYDKEGVDRAGKVIEAFLEKHSIPFDVMSMAEHGDVIRATVGTGGRNRNILVMGHRDTVFPKGEALKRPFRVEDGRAYGPGVADMKAGLVMNSFVAVAFAKFGGAPAPIVLLYTGDEEIASPSSGDIIRKEATEALAVFNSEPGRANGNVVVARRGCIFAKLEVHGKSAHSGVNFRDGRSAIEELAHKIVEIRQLTDLERNISINVGLISGGQSVNTVAPFATASIDLRYFQPADRDPLVEAITAIARGRSVEGTSATFEIYGEFPPLFNEEGSDSLFKRYKASASEMGISLAGELTHGAADSGFAAAAGAPTICGLGPVGGKYHSDEEYIELDSMVDRASILALTIMELGDDFPRA